MLGATLRRVEATYGMGRAAAKEQGTFGTLMSPSIAQVVKDAALPFELGLKPICKDWIADHHFQCIGCCNGLDDY
jgi:hypothetical protein